MVHRRHSGEQLGARILDWAEGFGKANGVRSARLDCVADNTRLVDYYRARGYAEVGRPPEPYKFAEGPRWGILMEKQLHSTG